MSVKRQPLWKRIILLVVYPAYLDLAFRSNNSCRDFDMPEEFKIDIFGDLKKTILGDF